MSAVGDARKRLAEQTTPARTPHWDPAVVQLIEQARAEGAAVESLALDAANERAERWKRRCEEARFDADHFQTEYADACKVIERVEALADRWAREAVERGPWDEVYTDGVVALLRAALRGPR